ncbi:MAG: helix-turn-helix transcriptional regulator [Bacteroidales bacterium]|nr:helix-turn-helix transcriptional regulator [Bacteroidales bacterium]
MEVEFFTYEDEVWYRNEKGENRQLTENDTDVIKHLITIIKDQYTDAYDALAKHFERINYNVKMFQFRIVSRFIKCNFGNIDVSKVDLDDNQTFNFEKVACPLRGECQLEGVVCGPKFNSKLSHRESEIARYLCNGRTKEQIADSLFISQNTVHNHIRNIYQKLGIHSIVELIKTYKQ